MGNWYFPNGELVPTQTDTQTSTLFTQRGSGRTELHRFGHPTQAGRYFCTAQRTERFYVNISKKLLSKGVVLKVLSLYKQDRVFHYHYEESPFTITAT